MSSASTMVWDAEQRKVIRDTFASGASDAEFVALMAVAERRNLDPFLKQIYFVKRWDSAKRAEVWAVQVSIDGLRGIAQRSGLYDGQDEPEFTYGTKKEILSCRVKVWRKDWSRPSVAVAHWSECAQSKKDGGLTSFWAGKPHVMLAKCAEALALRKAFPEDTGGLYVAEEMPEREEQAAPKQLEQPAPKVHVPAARETVNVASAPPSEPEHTTAEQQSPTVGTKAELLMERLTQATPETIGAVATEIKEAKERGDITAGERANLVAAYVARRREHEAQATEVGT